MDFSKLNIEFNNMQVIITKYNKMLSLVKSKIKNNSKEINKFENKIKNTKNSIEKESYKIVIVSLKDENVFLENLIKEDNKDGQSEIIKSI